MKQSYTNLEWVNESEQLPTNFIGQSWNEKPEHDHGAAEAHAEDDVIGEALPNLFRPLHQDGRRQREQGADQTGRSAPSSRPEGK